MWYTLAAILISLDSLWSIVSGMWDVLTPFYAKTPMAPLTSLLIFMLCVCSLSLRTSSRRLTRLIVGILTGVVAAIGVWAVLRHTFAWNSPVENALFNLLAVTEGLPARLMPSASGVSIILSAVAVFLIANSGKGSRARDVARGFVGALVIWTTLVGTLIVAPHMTWLQWTTPSAPATVAALLLFSAGLWTLAATAPLKASEFKPSPWLVTLITFLIVGTMGALYVRVRKTEDTRLTVELLNAIGDLHEEQISNWQKERLDDARTVMGTQALSDRISNFMAGGDRDHHDSIQQFFSAMMSSNRYIHIALFDSNLVEQIHINHSDHHPIQPDNALVTDAINARDARMSDVKWNVETGQPQLDIVYPIFSHTETNRLLAIALHRADATAILRPFIRRGILAGALAETLVVRREGESLVILNTTRRGTKPGGFEKIIMAAHPDAPAVRAVLDKTGIMTAALDLWNRPVFAVSRRLPDTAWFIIVKMDLAEILAPLRRQTLIIIALTLVIALLAGLATRLLHTLRRLGIREALNSEIERRHLLTSKSRDGIVILDTNGAIIEANESFANMLGYPMEQLRTLHVWDWDATMTRAELNARLDRANPKGEQFETRHRRADGTLADVEISSTAAIIEGKRHILAICRDITERKRTEAALIERELRFRTLFNLSPLGIGLYDEQGVFLDVNEAFCAIHGLSRGEIVGHNVRMFVPPEDRETLHGNFVTMSAGRSLRHEIVYHDKSGRAFNLSILESAIALPDGHTGVLAIVEDITIRKRAEQALRESEERIRSTLDSLTEGAQIIGFDERYLYVNDTVTKQGARRRDELLGIRMCEAYPQLEGTPLMSRIRECLRERKSSHFQNLFTYEDGHSHWFDLMIQPVPEGAFILSLDITEQRQVHEQMRLLSAALNAAANAIVITDREGTIEWVNEAFCRNTGFSYTEVVGVNPKNLVKSGKQDAEFYRHLWSTIKTGNVWHGELVNRRRDGSLYTEEMTITPVKDEEGQIRHFIAIKQDITEQKRLEAQFLRTQRLESVGRLASGVAHDLNNILAPILLSPPLLREGIHDPALIEIINAIEASAKRGAEIIQQLLTFGRGLDARRTPVQVRSIVQDMAQLIASTFPKNISVHTSFIGDALVVNADRTQLHQILMNLCINSRDAMPNGGSIFITINSIEVDRRMAEQNNAANPGQYIQLSVRDTGTGIAPEHLDKLFDPFFTTKGVGEGTGLGLSTVLGIVRSHKGFIQVESTLGAGTEFRIFLPVFTPEHMEPPAKNETEAIMRGHGETILIVDDEEAIRKIARQMLEKNGYRVIEAANGLQALALLDKEPQCADLILTDLLMPEMSGPTLIRALLKRGCKAKIVTMSGDFEAERLEETSDIKSDAYLRKPFTLATLTNILHRLL